MKNKITYLEFYCFLCNVGYCLPISEYRKTGLSSIKEDCVNNYEIYFRYTENVVFDTREDEHKIFIERIDVIYFNKRNNSGEVIKRIDCNLLVNKIKNSKKIYEHIHSNFSYPDSFEISHKFTIKNHQDFLASKEDEFRNFYNQNLENIYFKECVENN